MRINLDHGVIEVDEEWYRGCELMITMEQAPDKEISMFLNKAGVIILRDFLTAQLGE